MITHASALPAAAPLRVMVVDDSAVVRGLITRILTADPRIEVAASCSNGQMAVTQAARKRHGCHHSRHRNAGDGRP